MSARHWLIFDDDRKVIGCHCGFVADLDSDCGWGDSVVAHLFAAALTDASERIAEFDASDDYHHNDIEAPDYYAALRRAESLLRGEITTWHDPPADPASPADPLVR